jgi:hypothetical protein
MIDDIAGAVIVAASGAKIRYASGATPAELNASQAGQIALRAIIASRAIFHAAA